MLLYVLAYVALGTLWSWLVVKSAPDVPPTLAGVSAVLWPFGLLLSVLSGVWLVIKVLLYLYGSGIRWLALDKRDR